MAAPALTLASAAGRRALAATILASSMAFIDGSALNVALPALQDDLNASGAELLWIINAYLLLLASLILLGGSLGDHFGRNRVFSAGIVIFAAASAVCGLAPDTNVLIAARAVQGIGGALMVPGSLAILAATFAEGERGQAIGIWSSASTITTLGGPILGGFLADAGLWRAVFFINLPLAMVALFSLRVVPETRDEDAPGGLDYPGAVLNILGLGAMTFALIRIGDLGVEEGLAQPVNVIALVAGVVLLLVFVAVEYRSSHPLVNLALFRSRTFSGSNLMTAFLYAALYAGLFFLPLNLIQVQGYSATVAGLIFLPFDFLLALMSPWAGRLVDRIGPRLPMIVGPVIVGVGFVLLALPGLTGGPGDYWTTYFPGILAIGIGMGLTVAPLTTAVMSSVSSSHAGTASGVNNAVARSAQTLSIAAFGAIALTLFAGDLLDRTSDLDLTPVQQAAVEAEASELGNARPPAILDAAAQAEVEVAIDHAFVRTFRVLALVSAVLCWISALLSALMVSSRLKPEL